MRLVVTIDRNFANLSDITTSRSNCPEDCVYSIEMAGITVLWNEEELASTRVGIVGLGHGNDALIMHEAIVSLVRNRELGLR